MKSTDPTAADLRMGDALLDAIRAEAAGDKLLAARLAIPQFKADPLLSGAFVLSLLDHAIGIIADHCRETPEQTVERLWSKPSGAR